MEKDGLLNDTIRARLTSLEYDGINKATVEKLYIQEYGELPPRFEIIESNKFGIGEESGFHGTAVHFYNDNINEVYFINRGTEANLSNFGGLKNDIFGTIKDYKSSPEDLEKVVFKGNEDIYTDAYSILMGEDQSQSIDNMNYTDKVINQVNQKEGPTEPTFYLDGHSLGGGEAQTLTVNKGDLFSDVNIYNDAPMNIYNNIILNDDIKRIVEERYKIVAKDINDLKTIPIKELEAILDKEFSQYSNKITYYRNEDDIMTNLSLPYGYRLTNDSNVKILDSGNDDVTMIDLVEKYPYLTHRIMNVLDRANKEKGLSYLEMLYFADLGLRLRYLPKLFYGPEGMEFSKLMDDFEKMNEDGNIGKGHSMDMVIERIAALEGRSIVNNQEIIAVTDIKGGKMISLNIDATYQFYVYGHSIILGKKNALSIFRDTYGTHITDSYNRHLRKVQRKMGEIEGNPHAYLASFDRYTHDTHYVITYNNFRFTESLLSKVPNNVSLHMDNILLDIQEETERQEAFLEKYKEGIKKLTEADERVALLFDTYLERRESW